MGRGIEKYQEVKDLVEEIINQLERNI
jgi:hypothetical protein